MSWNLVCSMGLIMLIVFFYSFISSKFRPKSMSHVPFMRGALNYLHPTESHHMSSIHCRFFCTESRSGRLRLTYLHREKNDGVLQAICWNAISWMKTVVSWLELHWNLLPRVQLTINQHWLGQWLGAGQATSHYLNQWWRSFITHICHSVPMS